MYRKFLKLALLLFAMSCTKSTVKPYEGQNRQKQEASPEVVAESSDVEVGQAEPEEVETDENFNVAPPCQRTVAGTVDNPDLLEISGLDVSLNNDNNLYVHNDSGDGPTVYQIDAKGQFVREYSIAGEAVDWEDISIGPCDGSSCIHIADFGNNDADRSTFQIYRIKEGETNPVVINFRYPDGGAYNAETLAISPKDSSMYVIRKTTEIENTLYRFPDNPVGDVDLIKVCDFTDIGAERVTGGDIHYSGEKILIRTNENIYEYYAKDLKDGTVCGNRIRKLPHAEPQGEAVAYLNDSHSFYSVSEAANPPLYLFTCELNVD